MRVTAVIVLLSALAAIDGCSQGAEELGTEELTEGDTKDPRRLVAQVVEAVGGMDRLRDLRYKDVEGVMLPVYRASIDANWEGEIVGES